MRLRLCFEWILTGRHNRAYSIIEEVRSPNGNVKTYDLDIIDWADWGPDGTLLFGQAGGLYRQQMPQSLTDTHEAVPHLIADLTNQSFEHILAPDEARHWPTNGSASNKKLKRRRR